MRHLPLSLALLASFVLPLVAQEEESAPEAAAPEAATPVAAPSTNPVVLMAEGTKEFKDPESGEMVKQPYYDGLVFHRVIKGFMIQGGCPLGTGSGDPGYKFKDEINAKGLGLDKVMVLKDGRPTKESSMAVGIRDQRSFQQRVMQPLFQKLGITNQEQLQARQEDVKKAVEALTAMEALENLGYKYDDTLEAKHPLKGCLAMANSGPNTNGSQFFINLEDTPWLIGKHTVFGKVIKGDDVVAKIGETAVTPDASRPLEDVKILSIRVVKTADETAPADDTAPADEG